MSRELLKDFRPTTDQNWREAVEKELKGLDFDATLLKIDEIENLTFSKYGSLESNKENLTLGSDKRASNDWEINCLVHVKDEKFANQEVLNLLNMGASSITFQMQKKEINCEILLDKVQLDYIQSQFFCVDEGQETSLHTFAQNHFKKPIQTFADLHNFDGSSKNKAIKAYLIQQAGANAEQEIVFALASGHEAILKNAESVLFEFGIGANYLVEIAKFRAFRHLWMCLTDQYGWKGETRMIARSTFLNKSLKDPYTNLLRQTTEAMSAVLGGVDELNIQPYDLFSLQADRSLSTRMALNISHLLKEESYLNYVKDPFGGSFQMENITRALGENAWSIFNELEEKGGLLQPNGATWLKGQVENTRKMRENRFKEKKDLFIGMNQYDNPENIDATWMELPTYFDLPSLVLEKLN